jgi:hypothetical protein
MITLTATQATTLKSITPCQVKDGGIFEAEILAPRKHGAQKILFQGERRIADAIAAAINGAVFGIAPSTDEERGGHEPGCHNLTPDSDHYGEPCNCPNAVGID